MKYFLVVIICLNKDTNCISALFFEVVNKSYETMLVRVYVNLVRFDHYLKYNACMVNFDNSCCLFIGYSSSYVGLEVAH